MFPSPDLKELKIKINPFDQQTLKLNYDLPYVCIINAIHGYCIKRVALPYLIYGVGLVPHNPFVKLKLGEAVDNVLFECQDTKFFSEIVRINMRNKLPIQCTTVL